MTDGRAHVVSEDGKGGAVRDNACEDRNSWGHSSITRHKPWLNPTTPHAKVRHRFAFVTFPKGFNENVYALLGIQLIPGLGSDVKREVVSDPSQGFGQPATGEDMPNFQEIYVLFSASCCVVWVPWMLTGRSRALGDELVACLTCLSFIPFIPHSQVCHFDRKHLEATRRWWELIVEGKIPAHRSSDDKMGRTTIIVCIAWFQHVRSRSYNLLAGPSSYHKSC